MELVEILIELIGWIIDAFFLSSDVYSWKRGKGNRLERREARKLGTDVPRLDGWNRWAIVLTLLFLLLTCGLILWR